MSSGSRCGFTKAVKTSKKIKITKYMGNVRNQRRFQKLSNNLKLGGFFSSILMRIPPIKNPLKTKKIATPSKVMP